MDDNVCLPVFWTVHHFGVLLNFPLTPPTGKSSKVYFLLHLLQGMPRELVQTFNVLTQCILLTLVIPRRNGHTEIHILSEVQTAVGWMAMKCATHVYVPLRMS